MPDSNITKLALANSLKRLMVQKSFDEISVSNIADGCSLTRQSFYYHFKDKYDLMNWIYYTETTRIMISNDASEFWTDNLKDLCYYMQQNKIFYQNALNTTGQNSFPEYLREYIMDISISAIERILNTEAEWKNWEFTVSFFATAFVAFIVRWSNNGMNEDPAVFLKDMRSLFDGSIQREIAKKQKKVSPSHPETPLKSP
ncbi:MAG: dihydroxyacetone kinase transcriptional activator DhaS [Dehalobacter sp. 4CP]|nr:dihydroxyacetone kinase transcriptional activator DhaS [Dehalobacter sp. 4CP]